MAKPSAISSGDSCCVSTSPAPAQPRYVPPEAITCACRVAAGCMHTCDESVPMSLPRSSGEGRAVQHTQARKSRRTPLPTGATFTLCRYKEGHPSHLPLPTLVALTLRLGQTQYPFSSEHANYSGAQPCTPNGEVCPRGFECANATAQSTCATGAQSPL